MHYQTAKQAQQPNQHEVQHKGIWWLGGCWHWAKLCCFAQAVPLSSQTCMERMSGKLS
jgi:hypothetical protein